MRIHGLMLVKDELDIIDETVDAALAWCDRMYVFDNGSSDGTWERIKWWGKSHPEVVPYKQEAVPFSQALRGEIFRHFRDEVEPGDWWCVLDADEIYIDDPKAFLAAIPARFGEVWSSSFQYYFTDEDLERHEADHDVFHAQRVQDRLRCYLNNWSESRFMRHHAGLVWPEDRDGHPVGQRPVGLTRRWPKRIRLKHYQYRSPEQIQRRLDSRMNSGSYQHEHQSDWLSHVFGATPDQTRLLAQSPSWRDRVVPAALLHHDARDGVFVADEAALPAIPADTFHLRELKHRVMSARWRIKARKRQGRLWDGL